MGWRVTGLHKKVTAHDKPQAGEARPAPVARAQVCRWESNLRQWWTDG
jgi:hypothetical protein